MVITEEKVDKAAKYLRETNKSGQVNLVDWDKVPKSQKKKWLEKARGVLEAAFSD